MGTCSKNVDVKKLKKQRTHVIDKIQVWAPWASNLPKSFFGKGVSS